MLYSFNLISIYLLCLSNKRMSLYKNMFFQVPEKDKIQESRQILELECVKVKNKYLSLSAIFYISLIFPIEIVYYNI